MSSDFKFDEEETDDNLEESHCTIDKVYVFQIPKLTGASTGHSARDWPKQAIWSGRLRVVSKGRKCSVLLEHLDKDGLFAACPYTNKSCVEQVSDSSRYFVLRVTDGQGHFASIGIGFKQRSEAFNFKVALQDFENQGSRQEKAEEYLSSLPSQDYAIPQGKSIHVKLAAVGADTSTKTKKKKKKKEKEGVTLSQPPEALKSRTRVKAGGSASSSSSSSSSTKTTSTKTKTKTKDKPAFEVAQSGGEIDLFGLEDLSVSSKPTGKSVKSKPDDNLSGWDNF